MNNLFCRVAGTGCTLLAMAGLAAPMSAQVPIDGSKLTPFVTGLQGPRGLTFSPDGVLYVAEAGTGGKSSTVGTCRQVLPPIGPYMGGPTARISQVDTQGNRTTLATGLPSSLNGTGDITGVADVAYLDGVLYALLAGGGCSHGLPTLPNGIVSVNTTNGKWKYVSGLSDFYAKHPAAYPDAADFEPDGVPYSLLAYNHLLYSVEPNHGQIVTTTPQGVNTLLSDISFHFGHIVPTGIAEANGNLYVTNLGQFPITPDWEKIITFSQNASFQDTTPGLDAMTGDFGAYRLAAVRAGVSGAVAVKFGPDGLLYVLEFSTAANYPTPGTGKVVRLGANGVFQDVVTGLTVPTGMTFGPDGALYISNFGDGPTGTGTILRVVVP